MLQLTDSQQCALSIAPVDAKGNPAPVQGAPVWASSAPTVAAVTPSADGLSANIVAGATGTAQISVSADADLGDGVTTITGVLDVTVVGGQATSIGIVAGTPVSQ